MPLVRWFALVFMVLLQMAPSLVAAQEASSTPAANRPVPQAALVREFETTGLTLLGPTALSAFVVVYDSTEEAIAEFPILQTHYRDQLNETGGNLRPASAPKIGEERKAYAGSYVDDEQDATAGIFAWRENERIYVLAAVGLAGDMLTPLFDLATTLTGRELPGSPPIQATSPDEMNTGGAYELLPTLEDIPPGLVFIGDTDALAKDAAATPAP